MKLFTVGYEGCDIAEFAKGLKKKGIDCIADVRKNPVSRKPGFSKKRMAEELEKVGIEYLHFPGLGVPSSWRKEAKAKIITREKMFKDYVRKVLPIHQEEIETLKELIKKHNIALLCYEEDCTDCHRSFVAKEVQHRTRGKVTIVNLDIKPSGSKRLMAS